MTAAAPAAGSPDAGSSGDESPGAALPALGSRGEGWALGQLVLLGGAAAAGVCGASWPPAGRLARTAAASVIALAGAGLLFGGGAGLGRQLTPFPKPVADGELRDDGVYGLARHPMYGGALLGLLAWALVSSPLALAPLAAAGGFLEAKSRREEAWLVEQHPGYAAYRQRVRRRFVPYVW
jgi:protein-S-isoprenylcysteine O-methyltransferase Ste14